MTATWSAAARDALYTELCEAITATGDAETAAISQTELFLSRLCLLLMEQVADPDAVRSALKQAALAVPSS